ncbi:MAG TPA: BrnA antitoxin family protein [Anaerolineae bacterium]|nr:BrnA antitoxin family protein [Anaerolineae bacterium]
MKKRTTSSKSRTDWARLDAMQDEDIDLSDNPELTPEMFARAVVRQGLKPAPNKAQLTLRLDSDVLAWFKAQGRGYQTRINALLRAYMMAHIKQTKQTSTSGRKVEL